MLCERSYDLLSRMPLKGDEGGAKFEGGVAENGDFRQGGHYPWMILALRVTRTVPLPLSDPSTQRSMNGWSRGIALRVTQRARPTFLLGSLGLGLLTPVIRR